MWARASAVGLDGDNRFAQDCASTMQIGLMVQLDVYDIRIPASRGNLPASGSFIKEDYRGGYAAPGSTLTLAHQLVNTGSLPGDFRLDALNLALDGFDATGIALTHDRDRDGVPGPGDTPVALGGVVSVVVGDSASVLLS